MKIAANPNRHHVPAAVVCLVFDSRPWAQQRWADEFQVSLQSIKAWRSRGFYVGLWSAPDVGTWKVLVAEAIEKAQGNVHLLSSHRTVLGKID